MQNQTSILQDICKTTGLLPGTPSVNPNLQRALGWALQKPGINLQPTALQPILAILGDKSRTTSFRFEAQKLNLEKGFFPSERASGNIQAQLNVLKKELEKYNGDLTQMLRVLEWHGSTIACHPDYADISICDYIKMAAAIAHCLDRPDCKSELRLIAASVSGIQTYLYDIISKNAAKLLKGRSFYVQLLSDSLLEEMLRGLGLPPYNVVYASGGGFYVIVPDTPGIKNDAKTFFEKAANQIYQKHKTTLYVDWSMSGSFDENVNLDAIWDDLLVGLNRRKFKRLTSNPTLWDNFFEPAEFGGTTEKDPITNVEFDPNEKPVPLNEADEDTVLVSPLTRQQIDTGRALRNANYWATARTTAYLGSRPYEIQDPFQKYHWLEESDAKSSGEGQIRELNRFSGEKPAVLYGGNRIPQVGEDDLKKVPPGEPKPKLGTIKMFDLLAQGDSLDRLGILRMDVDNLGVILSEKAVAKYGLNFARYAAISRSLDWFFKGYLNTLHKNYQNDTLIIYSGGDDLFIIGRWREVLEFAAEIRSGFRRWTCSNPLLTISGGMSIVPGKFPVMQAAKMAAKAEDAAKDHCTPSDEVKNDDLKGSENSKKVKNAFTLFDVPLNWDAEFPIVESLKKEMLSFFQSDKPALNKSFLMKVTAHALSRHFQDPPEKVAKCFRKEDEYGEKKTAKPKSPRWRWLMAYDLSRYRDTVKDPTARAFVERVMQDAFRNNVHNGKQFKSHYHYLDLLLVAARWTELQLRTEGKHFSSDKT